MTITVEWYDEAQQAILITLPDVWGWAELDGLESELRHWLDDAPSQTALIYDVRQMESLPGDILGRFTSMAQESTTYNHPNSGQVYVIGAKPMLITLLTLFKRLFKQQGKRLTILADFDDLPLAPTVTP